MRPQPRGANLKLVAPGNVWRHSAAAENRPGLDFMKRKIAAIFAADIAGYSRLVAEDEEETLRRLASYRQVTDDFIAKAGGRIFNTAGDAVLADVATSIEELDRAKFAETIAEMEAKLAEKEGSELDHAVERLDHFKSIQSELQTTAMH